jgi:hypothetical protein
MKYSVINKTKNEIIAAVVKKDNYILTFTWKPLLNKSMASKKINNYTQTKNQR